MYRLSVPVRNGMVQKVGKETILDLLRRMGAERVFLSIDTYVTDRAERARELGMLEENSRFFHENGLETGVWLWTFTVEGEHDFTLMESLEGGPLPPGREVPAVCRGISGGSGRYGGGHHPL